VAINPYKRFPIYTQRVIKMYIGKRRNEVPPHIFCISDGAYMDMLTSKLFLSKRAKILNKNPSTHPPVKERKRILGLYAAPTNRQPEFGRQTKLGPTTGLTSCS
jgi:hypothetical protein